MPGSTDGSNRNNSYSGENGGCRHFLRWFSLEIMAVAFLVVGGLCFLSLNYSSSVPYGSFSYPIHRRLFPPVNSPGNVPASPSLSPEAMPPEPEKNDDAELIRVLEMAAMKPDERPVTSRGTVIITTLNSAWTKPGSLLDLFMESFSVGNETRELLKHLVIVTVDEKAHMKCQAVHPHCYRMTTPGVDFSEESQYMTKVYLAMMWRRLEFLGSILGLGYNFVFTDSDILWFRNPFPHFHKDVDIQIAADAYNGNSSDHNNLPNCGFMFFRSNIRTIRFHKYWYETMFRFPLGTNEQDTFNRIKFDPFLDEIGLRIRFLDTDYFGGNCSPVKDLNLACTMHANCLIGLKTKLNYLRNVLDDWKNFSTSLDLESRNSTSFAWMRH